MHQLEIHAARTSEHFSFGLRFSILSHFDGKRKGETKDLQQSKAGASSIHQVIPILLCCGFPHAHHVSSDFKRRKGEITKDHEALCPPVLTPLTLDTNWKVIEDPRATQSCCVQLQSLSGSGRAALRCRKAFYALHLSKMM